MQKQTERLGSAPLPSLLLKLSLPGIAATVMTSLYNIVDTFWVGRLGHEAIAALTIVFPYQVLAVAIGMGSGVGISALVSRRFGENDLETTNHVAGQTFFLCIFWGSIFLLAPLLFSDPILRAFGATPDIMDYSRTYLIITSFGAPAHIFIIIAGNLIRGSGDAIKPMVIMITASVLNIIMDPFLIIGYGPFPALGVQGAALATVIAQGVGTLIGLYYLLGNRTTFRFNLRNAFPNWPILKDIYRVGGPASIQEVTESLAFILFNKVVSSFGSEAIAAVGLLIRISDLAFMPIMGVSNALLPVVGFNFGARNEKRLWNSVKLATFGVTVLLGLFTIIIEIWTPQIVRIFSDDPEVLAVAVPGMRIGLATLVFIGANIMFVTAFQGMARGGMALFLSLIRQFLLFVPLLYLLRYFLELTGVWLALPASDILSFVVTFLVLYRFYARRKNLYPEQPVRLT